MVSGEIQPTDDEIIQILDECGYPVGHPLQASLFAQISRQPAAQKKEELENLLIEQAMALTDNCDLDFKTRLAEIIAKNLDIQEALNVAAYQGCNLVYKPPQWSPRKTAIDSNILQKI